MELKQETIILHDIKLLLITDTTYFPTNTKSFRCASDSESDTHIYLYAW